MGSWLQAVFIAPIEVPAANTQVNRVAWVDGHVDMIDKDGPKQGLTNGLGLIVGIVLMVLFTAREKRDGHLKVQLKPWADGALPRHLRGRGHAPDPGPTPPLLRLDPP